ncbi:MAG: hypothetical protein IKH51_07525 [Clostridia bacterium]|nr:hypothetical protein [Clostridia bacterium]
MKLKKTLSVILSVVMFLSLIPSFSVHAEEEPQLTLGMFNDGEIYDVIAEADYIPPDLLKNLSLRKSDVPEYMENTNLRESNAVVRLKNKEDDLSVVKYLNSDGTISDYVMAENVKYEKDGEIYDKTNRLEFSLLDGGYTNPDNNVNIKLPLIYDKNSGVELSYEKYRIEILPEKQTSLFSSFPSKENDEQGDYIVYNDVFEKDVDVEYHACFSGVKENIILNEKPSTDEFVFTIKTNGLVIDENGVFYDENDPVFVAGELVVYDNENKLGTGNITFSEEIYADTYKYTIRVDESFLDDEDTLYPVTVDPYIGSYTCDAVLYDVEVKKNTSSVNPTSTTARMGVHTTANGTTYSRIFYKSQYIENFANAVNASTVFAAYLYIRNNSTYQDYLTAQVCPITATWSYNAVSVPSTLYDSIVLKPYYSYLYNGSMTVYKGVNIKNIIVDFCNDTYDVFNGFCVKMKTENTSTGSCVFYSADHVNNKPYIVIMRNSSTSYNYLTSKVLYKVTNLASKTIQKVKNGSTYNVSYGNGTFGTGSTEDLSPFMAINEVPNHPGIYTLSFVCSKKENKQLYLNYYNYTNSLTLTESSNGSADPYNWWYIIFDGYGLYWRIINFFDSRYFISSSGVCNAQTDHSKWMFYRVGLDVPLIQQTAHKCGPTSTLQLIYYFGTESAVYGSTYSEKIDTIYANEEDDDYLYNGVIVSMVRNELNKPIYSAPNNYNYYNATNTNPSIETLDELTQFISNSLNNNCPVILHAMPSKLSSYYPSSATSGHYICLIGINGSKAILRDCNNNNSYFGEFIVELSEVFNATVNYSPSSSRYIICV